MSDIPSKPFLRFGIPSLDNLFGTFSVSHRSYGIRVESLKEQIRLAIVGPAGSGKSILALHLASRYAADAHSRARKAANPLGPPKVIYISTDLTLAKATSVWHAFALDLPNMREVPLYRPAGVASEQIEVKPEEIKPEDVSLKVCLHNVNVNSALDTDRDSLPQFLLSTKRDPSKFCIGFLDLLTHPTGDLWTFTNRLLASLSGGPQSPDGKSVEADQPLIIIDNVDGFETLVGELNTFGEPSSARARIMQVIQAAKGKAHLVFLAEESGTGSKPLEEVSDVVVKLRIREVRGYRYRAVEIKKARAQAIHRGDHYFLLRTGAGSTTALQENADDPRATNAYVQVIPSLHTVGRRIMNESQQLRLHALAASQVAKHRRAGFGLRFLDDLCSNTLPVEDRIEYDSSGLEYGSLTAVIGDTNTYKTSLGHKFIRRGFELFAQNLSELFTDWPKDGNFEKPHKIRGVLSAIDEPGRKGGEKPGNGSKWDELVQRFEAAGLDRQTKFLAEVLLHGQTGVEEWWDPGHIRSLLEALNGNLEASPALTLACSRWAFHRLTNRLKSLLRHDGAWDDRSTLRSLQKACLPQNNAYLPICKKFFANKEMNGRDFLDAAVERWFEEHRVKGAPPAAYQWEVEKRFLQLGKRKLELIEEVTKHFKDVNQNATPPKDGKLKACIREEWKSQTAYRFLANQYRGSTDFLLDTDLPELHRPTWDVAKKFDSDLLVRIFVGCAVRWIDSQSERRTNDLCKWLASIPGLESLANSLSLKSLGNAILNGIEKMEATEPDKSAIEDLARKYLHPPDPVSKDPVASILKIQDIVDSDQYGQEKITAGSFARWLCNLSPPKHPFSSQHVVTALTAEINALLKQKAGKTRLLCSVLVSAVLELVRAGHLSIQGHIDDELQRRRKAIESIEELRQWLKTHVAASSKGASSPDAKQCLDQTQDFVRQIRKGVLQKSHLAKLVEAISGLRGVYISRKKLAATKCKKTRFRVCQLILEAAARAGLMDGPAVLISANTFGFDHIQTQFKVWLGRFACARGYDIETFDQFVDAALDHLRKWLIVRRLEVHFLPTATLSAIVRASVELAESLLRFDNPKSEDKATDTGQRGSGIRLVIDGMASMKQTYPNLLSDSLFLPSLKLFADREGLTVLVVASQKGRPDTVGHDRFERETRNFFPNQIRTWWTDFFGQLRVAVSVIPPAPGSQNTVTRELAVDSQGELHVLRHFELYKGIDTGQPRAVQLEVRFLPDSPGVQYFEETLSPVLSDLFPAVPSQGHQSEPISSPRAIQRSDQMRDFGRLHGETHLDQTLLVQIQEYWSFHRSHAFQSQASYLLEERDNEAGSHTSDPLQLFSPTMADRATTSLRRRFESFVWNGYFRQDAACFIGKKEEEDVLDRVPFTWDFGFLLCNGAAWERAHHEQLLILNESWPLGANGSDSMAVGDVWGALRKARPSSQPSVQGGEIKTVPGAPSRSSWRCFAEAAVTTAARVFGSAPSTPALDVPVRRGDSLTCLALEMWASETYLKFRSKDHARQLLPAYFSRFTKRSWLASQTQGLVGLIAEPAAGSTLQQIFGKALAQGKLPSLKRHSLDLFKAILLLCEMIDINALIRRDQPFNLTAHMVNPEAVSARHWYTTACQFLTDNSKAHEFVPVRLPGNFSVRGDSYLAIARGSHSRLLGERALDLLSSRRGNDERLRDGIGLPVRRISDPESPGDLRTALISVDENGRRDLIRYNSLVQLGADDEPQGSHEIAEDAPGFYWLWRSTLGDYDAQSREFQRGLISIFHWWAGLKSTRNPGWKSGFHLYDAIQKYYTEKNSENRRRIFDESFAVHSLWEFPGLCDELLDRLRHATPRQ